MTTFLPGPAPELPPSSSQGYGLKSPGRALGSPSHHRARGCRIHLGSIPPSLRPMTDQMSSYHNSPTVWPTLLSTFLRHISLSNGICSTRVRKLLFTEPDSKAVAARLHTSSGALLPGLPLPGHATHCGAALPGDVLCSGLGAAFFWPSSGPAGDGDTLG